MNDESAAGGIVKFDFQHFFPHKFWVSNWLADETYPAGICYKVLSVRNEKSDTAELVLLCTFSNGTKEILHRANVPLAELEKAAHIFIDGLADKFDLNFQEQNYQTARTEDFHKLTGQYGWHMRYHE